jgi:hypothetical protein
MAIERIRIDYTVYPPTTSLENHAGTSALLGVRELRLEDSALDRAFIETSIRRTNAVKT